MISLHFTSSKPICKDITMPSDNETLQTIGNAFAKARLTAGLTQEQLAELAGISRPRYRDIEKGTVAARATTLTNIARALGLEMVLIPQALLPALQALMRPDEEDDLPAFSALPDDDYHETKFSRS
jgi:transcriptional regulator with XRE-family HTH domain